jgi:uncharacterized protein YecT (DUF1311 family)
MAEIGMRALLTGFLLATLLPAAALAAPCESARDDNELAACAQHALKQADAALNAAYRQVIARLGGQEAQKQQLVAAERAWMAYRDAECRFAASGVAGGSAYPMIAALCLEGLTRARAKALDAYLHCQEGDLSCPVPPPG